MTDGTSRTPVKTGGCQCGAVRYALYAQPAALNLCHCRMCQKAVGGPFAAFVPNQAADFAWTQGTLNQSVVAAELTPGNGTGATGL